MHEDRVLSSATTRKLLSWVFISTSFDDKKHLFHALPGRCESYFEHQTRLFVTVDGFFMDNEVYTKTGGSIECNYTKMAVVGSHISVILSTENTYFMSFQGDARAILSTKQGFSSCLTGSS